MQTINACLRGKYFLQTKTKIDDGSVAKPEGEVPTAPPSVQLDKKRLLRAAQRTKRYDSDYEYTPLDSGRYFSTPATVLVVDSDCLDVALWLQKEMKLKPVVLSIFIACFT